MMGDPKLTEAWEKAIQEDSDRDLRREFREPLPPGYLLVEIVGILFLVGLMLLSLLDLV